MQKKVKVMQKDKEKNQVKPKNQIKKDFLAFLNKNKKDLSTGFGAFHTDNHSNW